MDRKYKLYMKKSKELAKRHLMERLQFEMEINENNFNKINKVIKKTNCFSDNGEIFSEKEYRIIVNQIKKNKKNNSIIKKYSDIMKIDKENIDSYKFFY